MSFRLKTILGIAIIQASLLIILVTSSLNFLTSSNEKLISHNTETTAHIFTTAIKEALLSSDIATIQRFLEEIKQHPEMRYTQIMDRSGNVLAEFIAPDHLQDTDKSSIYEIKKDIVEADQLYGTVIIGVSTHWLNETVSEARQWGISISVIGILLAAFFSLILGTYLTKKLSRLIEATNHIKNEGPGFQIENHQKDEIGQVIEAFNQMSLELESTYNEQNENLIEYLELYRINKQTNAQTQAILNASIDAIVTINDQGIIIEFNQVAEKTFGWKASEVIGKSATETIIPEHYRKTHLRLLSHYHKTRKSSILDRVMQLEGLHKDGHTFPIEISISRLNLKNDTVFTSFIRDITNRINAEKEIKLSAVAIESGDALIIADAQLNILRVNKAYSQLTGFKSEEVINTKPRIFSKEHNPLYQEMWQTLNSEGYWSGEILRKNKQGTPYHERISISAVKDDKKQVSHYVIHLVNISEAKETEAKLREAQIRAENASLAKSQFLANMSHEIRSPLNSIITVNELLLQSGLPTEAEKLVNISLSGGKSLMSIINDVLDFSKIEAGEMQLKLSQFNIIHLIEEILDLFKHSAQEQNIHLSYIVDPNLNLYFEGDEVRVKQILTNLINNAIKFTTQGGVSIHVKNGLNRGLVLEVKDSGVGLTKEDAEQVFTKFFQADDSNTKKYEGTGLGLAIVYSLTQLMKGQISLSSELGKGCCFTIELPLEIDQTRDITIQDELRKQHNISALLLVSHDPFLQNELKRQLTLFNIKTISLSDLPNLKDDRPLVALLPPPYSQQFNQDLALMADTLNSNCHAFILVDPGSTLEVEPQPFKTHMRAFPLHFDHLLSILNDHQTTSTMIDSASNDAVLIDETENDHKTILIVEDSKTNQVIAQKILEQKGYQYEIANNGLEAVDKSNMRRYDLILMDMRMPVMDGIEATKHIRSHTGPNQKTPILAMTANAFTQDEEACISAGMNDFLTKPIDIKRFYQSLQEWLNHEHAQQEISAEPSSVKDPFTLSASASAKDSKMEPFENLLNKEVWERFKKDVGEEMLPAILEVYLSETKTRIDSMLSQWQQQNLQALSNEAHALKSSSGSFGLIALQSLAKDIEQGSRESSLETVNESMAQLKEVSQESLDIISKYLEESA